MEMQYNLLDALDRACELYPEHRAVQCQDASWTFGAFRERVRALANGLAALGLAPGERIALLADNCHRVVELYWAAIQLGAILVPLGTRLSEAELRYMLHDCAPRVLVADTPERLGQLRAWYPAAAAGVVFAEGAPDATAYESLMHTDTAPSVPSVFTDETPVAIFYTAAVEGKPRGAVITHRNWLAQVVQTGARLAVTPDDAYGHLLPLYHMFGAYMLMVSLCNGAANVVPPRFDADEAARLIQSQRITFFAEFAPMALRLSEAASAAGIDLAASLRLVVGIDTPDTIKSYLAQGIRWFNLYGQTEVAGLSMMGEVQPDMELASAVGRPLLLTRASLRTQAGEPVTPGESGELWIRSPVVVERYWPDHPTRLTGDGWLRSGDILRTDATGAFWFVGRTNDKMLIKTGGENVYPAEVERVLEQHPAIARACVIGVSDPVWKEAVRAVVVLTPGQTFTVDDARTFCDGKLARFKWPRDVVVAAVLPEVGGQIDRNAVKQQHGDTAPNTGAGEESNQHGSPANIP